MDDGQPAAAGDASSLAGPMPEGSLAKSHMRALFPTHVTMYVWPESEALNARLEAAILARAGADAGITSSNAGGWHSARDLFDWTGAAGQALRMRMLRMGVDVTRATTIGGDGGAVGAQVEAWANVSRDGAHNIVHDHPGAHWSGVYYVTTGEAAPGWRDNGALELLDPRPGVAMIPLPSGSFSGRCVVNPKPGLMVLFPSWLKHHVHPFHGQGARISIAFNIRIRKPPAQGRAAGG